MTLQPPPADQPTPKVLVLDLETTHLDERIPLASLLEFGAVMCDATPDLPPVGEASLLIRPPGAQPEHDHLWASMDSFVRNMHEGSGLWMEAVHGSAAWNAGEADRALLGWINSAAGTSEVVLAGSGVAHFDSRWLRAQMPLIAGRCTYWSLDASVFRRMLQFAGRDDLVDLAGDVEAKPHRALADARLHAAELRRYFALLQSVGRPDPVEVASGGQEDPSSVT